MLGGEGLGGWCWVVLGGEGIRSNELRLIHPINLSITIQYK